MALSPPCICHGQTTNKPVFSSAVHAGEHPDGGRADLSMITSPGGRAFQEDLCQCLQTLINDAFSEVQKAQKNTCTVLLKTPAMVLSIRVVLLLKEPKLRGFTYQYEQFPKSLLGFQLDFLPPLDLASCFF